MTVDNTTIRGKEYYFLEDIHDLTFEFAKVEDYINYTKSVGSTIRTTLSKESVKRQEEVWNIVTEQVKNNYANVDHCTPVRIDNESICATAKKR